MARGDARLSEQGFWDDPFATREETTERLFDAGDVGLWIDAPEKVPFETRATLPVWAARHLTQREHAKVHEVASTVLVATREATGEVFAGPVFRWKGDDDDASPATPGVDPGGGTMASVQAYDAREAMPDLPWSAGRYRLTLLVRGRASDAVDVELVPGRRPDPAVTEFVARHRAAGYPRPVRPAPGDGAWPRYDRTADSPELDGDGVALSLDVEALPWNAAACVLHGVVRRPLLPREIVRPRDAQEDHFAAPRGLGWVDVGDAHAVAVVPVTLVLVTDRRPGPYVIRLQVPVRHAVATDGSAVAHFHVDLFSLSEMPRVPDTYFVFGFSGLATGVGASLTLFDATT